MFAALSVENWPRLTRFREMCLTLSAQREKKETSLKDEGGIICPLSANPSSSFFSSSKRAINVSSPAGTE